MTDERDVSDDGVDERAEALALADAQRAKLIAQAADHEIAADDPSMQAARETAEQAVTATDDSGE